MLYPWYKILVELKKILICDHVNSANLSRTSLHKGKDEKIKINFIIKKYF